MLFKTVVLLSYYYARRRIVVLCTKMRPIVTDRVAWSVGRSVTVVNPAETAKPIEMPFKLRTLLDPREHVLGGSAH